MNRNEGRNWTRDRNDDTYDRDEWRSDEAYGQADRDRDDTYRTTSQRDRDASYRNPSYARTPMSHGSGTSIYEREEGFRTRGMGNTGRSSAGYGGSSTFERDDLYRSWHFDDPYRQSTSTRGFGETYDMNRLHNEQPYNARGWDQRRYVAMDHDIGYGSNIGSHRGKGPRNFMRSDERIREIVCEVLSDDHDVDATNIDVSVRDGEVTLTGNVHDRATKRRAEDIIADLPGVKDVQNQIHVVRGDSREATIDQLNSFLRGELSAVETYRMALDKLDRGSPARTEVESCMRSHEERVTLLRDQILRIGGTPATSSGAWGVFAKVIEGSARVLGDKAAIAALEEGEDHGLRDYRDGVDKLQSDMRGLVNTRLLGEQQDTHNRMSALKKRLSS